jgi:hypothetical protein
MYKSVQAHVFLLYCACYADGHDAVDINITSSRQPADTVTVNDTFYCQGDSNPPPSITWVKKVGNGINDTIPGGLLTITEDMGGDSSYSCVVQSTVGGNTSSAEASVSFFVGNYEKLEDHNSVSVTVRLYRF